MYMWNDFLYLWTTTRTKNSWYFSRQANIETVNVNEGGKILFLDEKYWVLIFVIYNMVYI